MFAVITIAALLAAAPVNAVMQWSMHAGNEGTIAFETRYRVANAWGHDADTSARSYPESDLEKTFAGLTHAQLFGAGTTVSFTIARQEGTLTCSGRAGHGVAGGTFTIVLDPNFATEMQRRGVNGVSPERQMEWLFEDADLYAMLDYFKSQGYPVPSVELLSRALDSGVSVRYARDLASAGMRALTVEQLVRAADSGVTLRYASALGSYGFADLSLDQAIRMVDNGVTPRYLTALSQLGYHVTPDQAVELVDHGVTAAYIARLQKAGYANLSVPDLIRLADHGVH